MGRVAIEMMKRLVAFEMTPRLYTAVYGFINIWKEPWQACQLKNLEGFDSGTTTGDMEYAFVNLYQYISANLYGCGENVESLSQSIPAYSMRGFRCGQHFCSVALIILHQLTLDLMGIERNAYLAHSNGMTEESLFTQCQNNNAISICVVLCVKKKYAAFFTGNMDTAAKMFDLHQKFPGGSTGRLVPLIVSIFIDGLIGFFLARKHQEDEEKWTNVGLDAINSLKKWVKSSDWNFSNKLSLLEAEYYFLKEDDDRAMSCYTSSINAARKHRFIHEEGLAEEKVATYFLHRNNQDHAMRHFLNANRCYKAWGAHALVQRVDKAIAAMLPQVGT